MKRGILITGTHRSGSTWVGRVLGKSTDVGYIQEPFHPSRRPGISNIPVKHWFQYVAPEEADLFSEALQKTLSFRYDYAAELASVQTPKDIARMMRDASRFCRYRLSAARPLMKDPLAFFSSEWIYKTFDLKIIILVRHPAAFAASLKRVGWEFDFDELTSQPRLVRDLLGPFVEEMTEAKRQQVGIVHQASLFWKMVYSIALALMERYSSWEMLRHEDIALRPLDEFSKLCERLEIQYSNAMRNYIRRTTAQSNPDSVPEGQIHFHKRNSVSATTAWRSMLSPNEVDSIRRITEDVSQHLYSDTEW